MRHADKAVKDYTIFLNVSKIRRIVLSSAVDTALLFLCKSTELHEK